MMIQDIIGADSNIVIHCRKEIYESYDDIREKFITNFREVGVVFNLYSPNINIRERIYSNICDKRLK